MSLGVAAASQCGICAGAVTQVSLAPRLIQQQKNQEEGGDNDGRLAAEIQAVWPADWRALTVIVDALFCDQDHRGQPQLPPSGIAG